MKLNTALTLFALSALAQASAIAADSPNSSASAGPTATLTGQVRLVKPDGQTVIAQAAPLLLGSTAGTGTSTTKLPEINVSDKDAFIALLGRCAFNLKYDEISRVAVSTSTNRLYSNDTLIAQNTQIALAPNVAKTLWTQPYLSAGANTVRLVINADSATPSIGLVRVHVSGSCGAAAPAPAPAPKPETKPEPKPSPAPAPVPAPAPKPEVKPEPKPSPAPAPVLIQPGSADWNKLNTAWGYSNYGVTQLKGKGYARYDELVKLNAALTTVINAKKAGAGDYAALMKRWDALLADPALRAAMTAIVPVPGK